MERSTMSVQELSSQMGISLPKAYELVKQPGFPVLRIGTRILIPVDSFNALEAKFAALECKVDELRPKANAKTKKVEVENDA